MENSMEFHGIPLNFHGIFHGIPWNFMEFYETKVDGIPWNSMESHGKFHGI
jgi:hypothetical protein